MSGGGLWIPNNPLMLKAGVHDSYENAKLYMDTVMVFGMIAGQDAAKTE